MDYTNPSGCVMIFFLCQSVIFDNLVKNLTVARVFRNNIWFSVPIPKIKFEPPPQGKNALLLHFRCFLNWQFFPEWEISLQN